MKKILLALIAVLGISASALAKDTYSRDVTVLPKAAQTVLAQNFKSKVSVIKIDKELGRISDYEVILTDGTEISFDRDGNWENIEVGVKSKIPSVFIPKAISNYVKTAQPGKNIVGIEKERGGYEIELSNGIDMKFDKEGKFLRYTD